MISFERVAPGHYKTEAAGFDIDIKREATTFAYPRGAENAMWFVYADGSRGARYRTLADAQAAVRRADR